MKHKVLITFWVSSVLLLALGAIVGAETDSILYVKPNASSSSCSSWSDACTLQTALQSAKGGDEIWVAAGTHKPTSTDDRTATFRLKGEVSVYGGFVGNETSRNERNWIDNLTILSGDIGATEVLTDNVNHVLTFSETDSTAVLDGFIITGGNANGAYPHHGGGGMWNAGDPELINITFIGNSASRFGGGMYSEGGSPTLVNVVFSGNYASWYGGGLYNWKGSPTLTNVTFSKNWVDGGGGGMYHWSRRPARVTNGVFWGNTALSGSQIHSQDSPGPVIVRYSLLEGGGYEGPGNLLINPKLADADGPDDIPGTLDDDLRLCSSSPAIDAGENNAVPENVATDLAGNPRFIDHPREDTGNGRAPIVDMGAYETENHAPLLDNSCELTLASIDEDSTKNSGTLVRDIIASAGRDCITDVDPGADEGLAVIGVDNSNGTWQYSTNRGKHWQDFGSPIESAARLLASDAKTRIRFVPAANFNGWVHTGITFRAWDQAHGINGDIGDASISGGATTFSTDTETARVHVHPINDPPTISDIPHRCYNGETSVGPIPFTIWDAETPAAALTLSAVSSDTRVVPVDNIAFVGSGTERAVSAWWDAEITATLSITITVDDGTEIASDAFGLIVCKAWLYLPLTHKSNW
jgi:predicted outer membrane repeat protein